MKKLYALLVGIDDYPAPVPRLRGCANDIREMQLYLESRVDPGGGAIDDVLTLKVLTNEQATRNAVIHGFRDHLAEAGPEDVALFCYSGHGSQEQAPEAFWPIEPDHLDETLVLFDSRSEGSWDLADKELAKLISDVAERGAHVVVVLDCCHSGSGTRAVDLAETAVRRAPTDLRLRPIESFLVSPEEAVPAASTRDVKGRRSGWETDGRHVLLAACRDDEEAKEYQGGGGTQGAFSYFLGQTLRTAGSDLTYRSLFDHTSALVRGQVQRQSPQLEATDPADLNQPFLGGAIRPVSRSFVASVQGGSWTIDAGRVHGIPAPSPEDSAEVALFSRGTPDEAVNDPSKAVAKARVVKVLGVTSQIEIIEGAAAPSDGPLKAVLTHLPTPRMKVRLEGDAQGLGLARERLKDSMFVRESPEGEAASYRLIARDGQYLIAKPDDDRPLVEQVVGFNDASARKAVERLEHIERWNTTAELSNPSTSIGPSEVQVEILVDGQPRSGQELRLEYQKGQGGDWLNPEITIRLTNTGQRTMFVGLLDLPQTFGIFPMLSNVGSQKLAPGEVGFANGGEPIAVTVPDDLWKRGMNEITDIVKVIVSTSEFDVRRMSQDDLDVPRPADRSVALGAMGVTRGLGQPGTLDRLMERVQTRHAGPGASARVDDWRSVQFTFTTVRPLPAGRLEPGRSASLTDGVRIEPHPSLRVDSARLSSLPAASRAVEGLAPLPRLLYDDPSVVQPFEFAPTRSVGGVLNVLELSGVNDPALVTPENPLRVTIPRSLAPGEYVLPVAFDGEFYLPLGRAQGVNGETLVTLDRLPQPSEAETRSLGGSLRILFQKVLARTFGTRYSYPILAAARVNDDFSVVYDPDPASVRARVAKAHRIALFVHGIIGDTREMAASLKRAGASDRYDLVLTFDYENLQDPISETARALKERLSVAGLGQEGHGKTLDVFAHSMGGLVSRWFIEREGGNKVVRRLVMLGTPNGGSPWPNVVDWATTAVAVGMNELSPVAWPAAVLGGLTQAVSYAEVTLEQMMPDSLFLKDLLASPDPGVPYLMIAGDTSRIVSDPQRASKLKRLLARLWSDRSKYDLADRFFRGSENDIAVSLASMQNLAGGRKPALTVRTVPCDHMTYFRNPASLGQIHLASGESV